MTHAGVEKVKKASTQQNETNHVLHAFIILYTYSLRLTTTHLSWKYQCNKCFNKARSHNNKLAKIAKKAREEKKKELEVLAQTEQEEKERADELAAKTAKLEEGVYWLWNL